MRASLAALFAATLMQCLPAAADDLVRKGGEWESTVTGMGPQPHTMVLCFAPATWDQAMAQTAARGQNCSKRDVTRSGNVVTFDMECTTMKMHGTATFTGNDAYTADMMFNVGSGADAKSFHAVTQSKWIGPCKPGEKALGAAPGSQN